MHTPRILFVVTSADSVQGMSFKTGSWLEEVAAPYYTFVDARCDVTLASPKGGIAPIDATSLQPENQTASTRRFTADTKAIHALEHTAALSGLSFDDFDAVFFAGGHGTMEDFPTDVSVKHVLEEFYAQSKLISAVCHGPACLVQAVKPDGSPLIKSHAFTCFTDAEETSVGLSKTVPFMLETELVRQGGVAETAPPFEGKIVVSLPLITGQNPASAIGVAEAVIHQLRHMTQGRRVA